MTKRCTAWHIGGRKRFIERRVCGKARQRDDASIVPYKLFAAFIIIGKVSLRRDEGIPPYRDKIPFGVHTKKAELLTALLLNSTPFVRQYDILSNKWGVLLCQKEYQTNDIRRSSREWL